jgi:hypothetical protein
MARGKKTASVLTDDVPDIVSAAVTATVHSAPGLNLRKNPARNAPVLRVLKDGETITLDNTIDVPGGWKAVAGGGFVMAEYLEF